MLLPLLTTNLWTFSIDDYYKNIISDNEIFSNLLYIKPCLHIALHCRKTVPSMTSQCKVQYKKKRNNGLPHEDSNNS